MIQEQQQIINYLMWMKDRGLSYFEPTSVAAPIVPRIEAETPVNDVAPAPKAPLKAYFLSHLVLSTSETEMVERIASALGLSRESYALGTLKEYEAYQAKQVIALGEDTGFAAPSLVIPHPRAMIKEPSLKATAWNALQQIKAQL